MESTGGRAEVRKRKEAVIFCLVLWLQLPWQLSRHSRIEVVMAALPVVGTSHSGTVAPARQQALKCLQSREGWFQQQQQGHQGKALGSR